MLDGAVWLALQESIEREIISKDHHFHFTVAFNTKKYKKQVN